MVWFIMENKLALFTIPFAGGNRFSFNKFNEYLENDFDIYHLELAGRGERLSEELIFDIYELRDDLFKQIEDKAFDREYIIYGHSLGGLLGYLLILLLEEKGLPRPLRFIVSGRANPMMKSPFIRYNLSKDDFAKSLKKLGGMPSEFFNHPELFDFFEPILRADFEAVEKFDFNETRRIETKISILYGNNESFSKEEAQKWKEFSCQDMDFYQFEGGHFFIFDHIEDICNIIKYR